MDAPNWDRVKAIFQDALERPAAERAAWLRERCGSYRALQAEVESLLAAHDEAGSFAARPAVDALHALGGDGGAAAVMTRALQPGDRLGVYEIQAMVGAGGMGEVYQARDTRLHRTVAIKVLPANLAADRSLSLPETQSGRPSAQSAA
jgi:eukaryotic-like serine/threonine-protein kinase